jgi:ubiquinone/menaquinone biosynthesis C-methylase UbiE
MKESLFNASMPVFYDRYLGPVSFHPFANETAARVKALACEKLVEVACGTGIVTCTLARALPGSIEIVASDISYAMVDFARKKHSMPNIQWCTADAQVLPLASASVDLVLCQFGLMFMPDKHAALREARRVLRPGGRCVLAVWDSLANNDLPRISADAVAEMFARDPPTFMRRVPYGYTNHDTIMTHVREAGFSHGIVEVVKKTLQVPSAQHYAIGLCQGGPLRGEIEKRDQHSLERATQAASRAVERHYGSGSFEATAHALYVTALA